MSRVPYCGPKYLATTAGREEKSCMPEPNASQRLKTANTLLALVILILLGQAAWQAMRISALKAEVAQSQRTLETRVERLAVEKLAFPREELASIVQWLDEFYKSPDGLQRPGGLVNRSTNQIDGEAIGAWVLDVYLKARLEGATPEDARQRVAENIRGTDEWQRKHPK
jgi:hypothetical protein